MIISFFRKANVFIWILLLVLPIVLALMIFRLESDLEQFQNIQDRQILLQNKMAVKSLYTEIERIRTSMDTIASDQALRNDFATQEDIEATVDNILRAVKMYVPNVVGFSLSDHEAERLGGDFDFVMGPACKADLISVTNKMQNENLEPYKPVLHPHGEDVHFDMMLPFSINQENAVMFISYKASILQDVLEATKISTHDTYIVKSGTSPFLIESSVKGVRTSKAFMRDGFMSEEEMQRIKAEVMVPDTHWSVVTVEDTRVFESFKASRQRDTGLLMVVFLILWGIAFTLIYLQDKKRIGLINKLKWLSFTDELTGAINRRALEKELRYDIENSITGKAYSGVLFLDLNGFKPVNDTYGHDIGDEVLKIVTKRLFSVCRGDDLVARLGGDEFVVVIRNLGNDKDSALIRLMEATNRVNRRLSKDHHIDSLVLQVGASIGTVLVDGQYKDVDTLLKAADELMYQVKKGR